MSETARKAEAKDEKTATFKWRGHTFTVNRYQDDWTLDLLESIEEGKSVGIVRGALGPVQWQTVKAMQLKVRDLNDLSGALVKALGFDNAGNSSASSA